MRRLVEIFIYLLSAFIGIAAFAYPFFLPQISTVGSAGAHAAEAPLLTTILIFINLVVLLIEIQGQTVSAKVIAALGVLIAITAVLRFFEVVLPVAGGFSPIFVPIILAGYVFGYRFGFLMGTLSMLASGLVTGNVGPWLPFQMFTAGWVGMSAGWLPHLHNKRLELGMLVVFGVLWGFCFGIIMNLYFWPFVTGDTATSWQPGTSIANGISRYTAFYILTSLFWDIGRAAGNGILILILGRPILKTLIRFRDRFHFTMENADYSVTSATGSVKHV